METLEKQELFWDVNLAQIDKNAHKKYSLAELIGFFEKKYSNIKYNVLHVLKSLVYFEDAENEPSPIMFRETNWEDVKSSIQKAVSELSANHN